MRVYVRCYWYPVAMILNSRCAKNDRHRQCEESQARES